MPNNPTREDDSPPRGYQLGGGLVPVPDPTRLTTDQLLREIAAMRREMVGQRELLEAKVESFRGVFAEKFVGVDSQFKERDTRTDQRAGDTKLAVDAAFAAAKEATGKIEAGFTKQIDSMNDMIDTKTQNAEDKISDLKDRLTTMESHGRGGHDVWGYVALIVGLVIAFAAIVFPFLLHKTP